MFPYQNPALPMEKRIDDLVERMTLEEKVGQLVQANGQHDASKKLAEQHVGSILQLPDNEYNDIIEQAKNTRLGIPLLLGVDAIHGNSFLSGATIFPSQLGMACTWDDEVIHDMASITAKEMRYSGMNWTFSPVLCLTRDLRWGRVDETFGEDPYLIGRFATQMIHGYQGDKLSSDHEKVLATAKHYAGYSETQGGRDASEADLSRRKLSSYFLPPFRKAVEAGCGAFMTGYQSMEGVPSTANPWLLRHVLKEEWGFQGLVVTDWNNVGSMVTGQRTCPDFKTAAAVAVKSGNDLIMSTPEFYQGCLDALAAGMLELKYVEEAVRRILRVKFELGLFEDPRWKQPEKAAPIVGCAAHRNRAASAARESLVLLENNGILPLAPGKYRKIAVVGPLANDALTQCGDWSLGSGQAYRDRRRHPRECTVTLLDGLKERFDGEIVREITPDCDLVIAAVGDDLKYVGEWRSSATLELQDGQNELLAAVAATGKPFVIDLICSKPQILPSAIREKADAIMLQFSPGMLGGKAFAGALFGDFNPSGRLTVSVPYHVGQMPMYYSLVRGAHGAYSDMPDHPLYAFGYGLSYSKIEYRKASLTDAGNEVVAHVTLYNDSDRDAVEVVQGYVSDLVTSVTWADMELKAFARVTVPAHREIEVVLSVAKSECSIVDADCRRIVEPGDFELRIGRNARDIAFALPFTVC